MIELLLLLPVAMLYGWYMGKNSARREFRNTHLALAERYAAGLNYLLSEHSDQAVDRFIAQVKVDDETLDSHLGLAAYYRARGEVERAIKLHQNIISRPSLAEAVRDNSMFELGKDYFTAGLFDRAESIYLQLMDSENTRKPAANHLLQIYEQTREWKAALELLDRYRLSQHTEFYNRYAHYCCELEQERVELSDKQTLLARALKAEPHATRALMRLAELSDDPQQRVDYLCQICEHDPQFAPVIVEQMVKAFTELGQPLRLSEFLHRLVERNAGASALIALSALVEHEQRQRLLSEALEATPNLKVAHALLAERLSRSQDPQQKQVIEAVIRLLSQIEAQTAHYQCQHCGLSVGYLHWQCPSCKSWSQIKPIFGIEGE